MKEKVIEFVDAIELSSKSCVDNDVKRYLEHEVKEARYYLKYNEWFLAFEILADNLYEISYKMDHVWIDSAKAIFLKSDPAQSEETLWWLNELRKN